MCILWFNIRKRRAIVKIKENPDTLSESALRINFSFRYGGFTVETIETTHTVMTENLVEKGPLEI